MVAARSSITVEVYHHVTTFELDSTTVSMTMSMTVEHDGEHDGEHAV